MKGRRPGARPAPDTPAARTAGDLSSHGTKGQRAQPSAFQSLVVSPLANLLGGGRGVTVRRDMGPDIPPHESENAHMLSSTNGVDAVSEEDMLTLQGFAGAQRLAQIARQNGDASVVVDDLDLDRGERVSGGKKRKGSGKSGKGQKGSGK